MGMTYPIPPHRLGAAMFFTLRLAEPSSDLLTQRVDLLRAAVRRTRAEHPFDIDAWVTLPDHLHCVWKLPPGDTDHGQRWAKIMARFVKSLKQDPRQAKAVWHPQYWDHPIVCPHEHQHLVRYCWMNPVKHRLVKHPGQWLFSSWHRDRVEQIADDCAVKADAGMNMMPSEQAIAH